MININANPIVLASFPIQSWADSNKCPMSWTLDYGYYIGTFCGDINNWCSSIQFTSPKGFEEYFVHPSYFTTNVLSKQISLINKYGILGPFDPPGSKGCQMPSLANFNSMMSILRGNIGFYNGNTININITNFWCTR